ncbi:hypothetical protein FRB99_002585 [Tulasnella sp. 403]|nr:hypothetical protein FRB99_002585 [Tulasnella sp. 403]
MEAQYEELIPFLHDRNPAVRGLALQTLLEQTPNEAPHRNIFFRGISGGGLKASKEPELFRDLKLLCRDQPDIAHSAFKALVNLSDSPLVTPCLSDKNFLTFLVSYAIYPPSVLAELASMILSNLTAHAVPCNALTELSIPVTVSSSIPNGFYPHCSRAATAPPPPKIPADAPTQGCEALSLLLDAFVQAAKPSEGGQERKANLHFLASVFANITTTPKGRLFFLTPRPPRPFQTEISSNEYPLAQLTLFTEHSNIIRRGGVSSTIKNCCFHVESHKAIISPEDVDADVPPSPKTAPGINAVPAILLPLAGPEEFELEDTEKLPPALQFLHDTKRREPDPVLRLTHIESLVLLCTSRWGRDQLRGLGVYEIIRTAHESEKDEKIIEAIEKLVNLLKRAEPAIEEVEDDAPTATPAQAEIDEDDTITEV